ncbi:MAG: cytochrome o ubiquinol oxidase subunit IV [Candidatus Dormibacteria bacterium]|jgi:cytochrome o ubiquinol oxidase operon protein cyoD
MSQHAGTERLDSGLAHAGVRSYVSGFAISILLTIAAYLMVTDQVLPTGPLIAVILVVALAQFGTQLYCFLHLGTESRPRWKLLMFVAMVIIVLILVLGSLWIMRNLDSRMTIPQQEQYMNSQQGI